MPNCKRKRRRVSRTVLHCTVLYCCRYRRQLSVRSALAARPHVRNAGQSGDLKESYFTEEQEEETQLACKEDDKLTRDQFQFRFGLLTHDQGALPFEMRECGACLAAAWTQESLWLGRSTLRGGVSRLVLNSRLKYSVD